MSSNISEEDSHIPDYDNVRSDLFNEIFARHGMASFQLYWSSFRRFIIGQLSKEEFDIVVKNVLSEDKESTAAPASAPNFIRSLLVVYYETLPSREMTQLKELIERNFRYVCWNKSLADILDLTRRSKAPDERDE